MNLIKENTTRKIDSLGRVSIPKGMRDRLAINEGDEMEFYLLQTDDGAQYVCLTNHSADNNRFAAAANVLTELGLEVPVELAEKI